MFRFYALLAFVLFKLLYVPLVFAQSESCVHHIFSAYDSNGSSIAGLTPKDFEAKVRGKDVKILAIAPDMRPHRLVLIVDASPSLWQWELTFARHFLDQNHGRAQIALLIFNKHTNEVVNFAQGGAAVNDALKEAAKGYDYLRTNGRGTTLQDAVLQGIQLFDRPTSADALYVLTDAVVSNGSPSVTNDADQQLVSTGVRLFAVLFQREIGYRNKTSEEVLGPEALSEMARKSGGGILTVAELHDNRLSLSVNSEGKATTAETLAHLYQGVLEDSVLELGFAFPVKRNESFELKLSDIARRQWKNARLFYSEELTDCESGSIPN